MVMKFDLAIVMPVYNEKDCIAGVLNSWLSVLSELRIQHRIIVLDDGSTDGTEVELARFKKNDRLMVIRKENSGHGPTILMGYQKAVDTADWVFQCDSDNEIKADDFPLLWENRKRFDAVFGKRRGREQSFSRKLISLFAFCMVRLKFGPGITDINTPYRLIRAEVLRNIIIQIPQTTFAPNVLISGCLAKYGFRIYEMPVSHEGRKTGNVSIIGYKLLKSSITSFWQTLIYCPQIDFSIK
jgi:dolichol-phosphate mannosyltransferase